MTNYYNNIGIGAISLGAVLNQSKELTLSKVFLIFPLLSHQKLLQHLGRNTTKSENIESLVVEKIGFFSNFNRRYESSLVLTTNALQYLNDTGYISIKYGLVSSTKPLKCEPAMGSRSKKIFNAAKNVSLLLKDSPEKLYLNLRVEI